MTYEETVELEENVKLKNKANEIYNNFMANVKLPVNGFDGNRFKVWSDSHNAKYVAIENGKMIYQCRYLHETYNVIIEPSAIFKALKSKDRGVEHLEYDAKNGRF